MKKKDKKYEVNLESALSEYKNIKPFKENIGKELIFTSNASKEDFDLVITIGGDGTILWAHKLLDRDELPPFVCFDGGSLCFLSNFSLKKIDSVLEYIHNRIIEGEPFDIFSLKRVKSFVSWKN